MLNKVGQYSVSGGGKRSYGQWVMVSKDKDNCFIQLPYSSFCFCAGNFHVA
jgi:hypothetical protein